MAGDPFKKATPGQRLQIPADAYNAFIDAALAHKQGQVAGPRDIEGAFRSTSIIKVRNISGDTLDQFSVVGLGNPLILPADNEGEFTSQILLEADVPADPDHVGKYAILLEPLPDGRIGDAVAHGLTVCRLSVTAEADTLAEIEDGIETHLKTGDAGTAKIVWKESGTGTKWGVVRLFEGGSGGGGESDVEVIKVTSTTPGDEGYLPGVLQSYDTATNAWSNGTAIWVLDINA